MNKFIVIVILSIAVSIITAETMIIHFNDGETVEFRIEDIVDIRFDFMTGILDNIVAEVPLESLKNYPNPFNPQTTISFHLNRPQKTRVEIFNIKGQIVRKLTDELLNEGSHQIIWDGRDNNSIPVATGTYFYRVKTEDNEYSKKMLLLK